MRNLGDYRIFKNIENPVPRKERANKNASILKVLGESGDYEGDCIHVDESGKPTGKQFGYYWAYDPDLDHIHQHTYDQALDEGYRPVRAYKPGEGKPGKDVEFRVNRWRLKDDGRVTYGGHILMAIPSELLDEREEEERNRRMIQGQLDQEASPIHELAAQSGLGSYVTRAGKTEEVVRARK